MRTASKGRTHGCTDQPAGVKKVLANSEPSTHGTKRTNRGPKRSAQVWIRRRNVMDRRSVVTMMVVTAASLIARTGHAQVKTKARNIVLVHGLFADGSCWSEVIARLQAAGLNATAVQNP